MKVLNTHHYQSDLCGLINSPSLSRISITTSSGFKVTPGKSSVSVVTVVMNLSVPSMSLSLTIAMANGKRVFCGVNVNLCPGMLRKSAPPEY